MARRLRSTPLLVALLAFHTAGAVGAEPAWEVPAEGACVERTRGVGPADVEPFRFSPGAFVPPERVPLLEAYVPPELWPYRERFFFEGMRLEIGPCHRDYSPPAFYQEASERNRTTVSLADDGKLEGYVAGLAFPPDTIAPDDPQAGLKWAWNMSTGYSAAGSFGKQRTVWVTKDETIGSSQGEFFILQAEGRADLAATGFREPSIKKAWVSSGWSQNSDGARCAWRQEPRERGSDFRWASDEARRIVRQRSETEGAIIGCVTYGGGLTVHGADPTRHDWKVLGTLDILAPINSTGPLYPDPNDRNFGPWGISFASDRWELRRVIRLEGTPRELFEDRTARFVWYVDLQTMFPLYYVAVRDDGRPAGVGHMAGQWSEDRPDYRPWPDDPTRPVRRIDAVGSAFVDWNERAAVRTESGQVFGTPPESKEVKRMTSESWLLRMVR